jgi:hypothetical protein
MKQKSVPLFALLTAFLVVSGHGASAAPRARKGKAVVGKPLSKAAITNMPLVKVTDPAENSFSMSLPKGWRNQAYLARTYELVRPVSTALSPDGSTLLFTGDPRLPSYTLPNPEMDQYAGMIPMNPLAQVAELAPAGDYFRWYVTQKFGKLPGFRIGSITPDPAYANKLRESGVRAGRDERPEAVRVAFTYRDNNKTMHALLNGFTSQLQNIWIVGVSGVTTTGDPALYNDLVKRVVLSHKTNPQWAQRQQQLHEQRMAQLRSDYANQMARFNAANQSHQMRMNAIQDAGNANMKKWYEGQAASDKSHRNFMNYITDEHTVVAAGQSFQVDNSHQRYFVNKNDHTYIGTDSTTSLDDLREMGVDPSDYMMAKIKR